jgi:hypothetical protein
MTSTEPSFEEALQDLGSFLRAIHEYLGQVVLCGGWVPYFYRHLPRIAHPRHDPLFTFDFDVVIPSRLPPQPAGSLHDQLLKGDFVDIQNRDPPVVFYQHSRWGTEDLAPIYGELLTPLEGSIRDRSGKPKDIHRVQDDVVAQQLRYVQLLLHEPLIVQKEWVPNLGLSDGTEFQIPNPASYILQKALALKGRPAEKQQKDLAYFFEVAALWFNETERVREMVGSIVDHSSEWSKWVERGKDVLDRAFQSEHSEGPVSAEQVFSGMADGHVVSATAAFRLTGEFLTAAFD